MRKVIVMVENGVAELMYSSPGVEVEIVDMDALAEEHGSGVVASEHKRIQSSVVELQESERV